MFADTNTSNHLTQFKLTNMKYIILCFIVIAAGTTVHAQTPPVRTADPVPAQNTKAVAAIVPVKTTDSNARTVSAAAASEAAPIRKSDPAPAGNPSNAKKELPAKDKVLLPSEQPAPAAAAQPKTNASR